MKITKDDLVKMQDEPIELFYQGIKAADTKKGYTRRLNDGLILQAGAIIRTKQNILYYNKADVTEYQ